MKNFVFSFDELSSKNTVVKSLKKAFTTAGAKGVSVDIDTKIRRKAGFKSRSIHVGFADNQTVTFLVKESGDIFHVKVNNRMTPVTAQDDHKAAIKEIVSKLDAGRTAFQKKLAKAKVSVPKGMTTSRKSRLVKLQEKRDGLQEAIADVRSQIDELKAAGAA